MAQRAVWAGEARIKGSNEFVRMSLLTAALLGLQLIWGLEMTYCMPYLLELGLSKSNTSLVWVAGPLSGLIVAPIVGAVSDKSTSSLGRRRPFMIAGSLVTALCFYALAWAREIMAALVGDVPSAPFATIIWAVLCIYGVDFAINVVQWSTRSLIVDSLPTAKQQTGSAWATRTAAVGHLLGYAIGAIDLKTVFGTAALGGTQLKQMTNVSNFSLLACVGLTCWAVQERVLIAPGDSEQQDGVLGVLARILSTAWNLPLRMQGICNIQFWAWIGWFFILFYGSTWVGETHFYYDSASKLSESKDRSGDIGRIGSTAMIAFALVTLAGSITLPWLIKSPEDESSSWARSVPASLAPIDEKLKAKRLNLKTAWMASHFVFGISMMLAPFAQSTVLASIMVAALGIPWALAGWAPFAFMGVEINRMKSGYALAHRRDSIDLEDPYPEDSSDEGTAAGVFLGILNLYTAGPQFVGSFVSMGVFWVFERSQQPSADGSVQSPVAIAWCLFIGAMCAFVAAWTANKYRRMDSSNARWDS